MATICGLLLVYRRCVAGADISSLVRFGQMWSDVARNGLMLPDAVISHTEIWYKRIHPNYFYGYGSNSQLYLVNAKPGTNHSTNPTNPNGNSKR